MSSAVPTGYSGMKPFNLRKPKLYEQFNIPQYASPRPSTKSLPVSSAAATNMQGPSKNFLIKVSGVSGPKLPKKTTKALQPACFASSTAFTASFSFSTVTLISLTLMPAVAQAFTTAARRRSDSDLIKQSLDTAITPRLTVGILGSMLFSLKVKLDYCYYLEFIFYNPSKFLSVYIYNAVFRFLQRKRKRLR